MQMNHIADECKAKIIYAIRMLLLAVSVLFFLSACGTDRVITMEVLSEELKIEQTGQQTGGAQTEGADSTGSNANGDISTGSSADIDTSIGSNMDGNTNTGSSADGTRKDREGDSPENYSETFSETVTVDLIWVYVCGEVLAPGVYGLPVDARGLDALESAGGFSENANRSVWNLAAPLSDGMMIYVPSLDEDPSAFILQTGVGGGQGTQGISGTQSTQSQQSQQQLVNINTADVTLLMTLPGIGQTRAEAIIAYRETAGLFREIEDLMQVSGIGEASFARLRSRICVR